jgi:dihydroorotate dehydrogenase (fumarate)
MILKTRYLGLELKHPFMLGASPLGADLDAIRAAEDYGVAAVVLNSLFEEDVSGKTPAAEKYFEQIRHVKAAVAVPVIASLNGTTSDAWLECVRSCEQAGADAVELNVYGVAADPAVPAAAIEHGIVEMVQSIKRMTSLPLAIKLSPYYTSLAHFVCQLNDAGADGFVLFNRFYQPDIDPEALDMRAQVELSTRSELALRLRWLAVLSPLVRGSLAVSGGVHSGADAVKALMAGAHAVQVVSEILAQGPKRFRGMIGELIGWIDLHEYGSVSQIQGSMNLERCADIAANERADYRKVLGSWPRGD